MGDPVGTEFEAKTPYMYSTYEAPIFGAPECVSQPTDRQKIVILGGGPNRIGQGIEFDYCCCHAAYALADPDSLPRHPRPREDGDGDGGDAAHPKMNGGVPLHILFNTKCKH